MSSPDQAIISARDVQRVFRAGGQDVYAVRDVSLDIHRGEFLAITGRSGSGKTTLLNLLGGLDRPSQGKVLFHDQDLSQLADRQLTELRRHSIGFVFQSFGLLPLLSAYENAELPLLIAGVGWRERRGRVSQALEVVGLGARVRHRPFELSGGEQQRVAIARALANGPQVVIADEPTGELDSSTALAIAELLRQIVAREGVTVVIATHDPIVMRAADYTREMVDGAFVQS